MASPAYQHKYFVVRFPSDRPYVAHVEINRPDKLNTFIEAMWLEMRHLFDQLSTDPSVRAIVLTGSGDRAFSAGLDVKEASTDLFGGGSEPARKAVQLRRFIGQFQDCITAIERCEKPVICTMHGFAYGLAIDICSAADIRLCTKDVKFAVKEVDIGLAADIGVLSRLPKIVGDYGWVKEVALTARVFGAEEAKSHGLVNAVYDSKQAALEGSLDLAGLIAQKSPIAVQGTKEILNYSRDHSVQDGLRYTAVWNSGAIQTKDVQAALLSGLEKRVPTFEKL